MTDHENPQNVVSTLDVRGMVCSKPVIKIKVQLKKMKASDTLEVLATENNYRDLVRLFGEAQGHTIDIVNEGEVVKLLITKV
jgi:TusA-related sulfurtransferase